VVGVGSDDMREIFVVFSWSKRLGFWPVGTKVCVGLGAGGGGGEPD